MGIDIELPTRPLSSKEMQDILFAARDRLETIFGEDGVGLKLEPRSTETTMLPKKTGAQEYKYEEEVRWGNNHQTFWFTQRNWYYEGQPPYYQYFELTCHNVLSICFWLSGTGQTGKPITSIMLHLGFISGPRDAALQELFHELLG